MRRGAHPGARASRPHAVPSRSAQFPRDGAPGHPAGRNAMGPAEAESWSHPGTRASRLHAVPSRSAQFPRDGTPGHPAGRNGVDSAEAESWSHPGARASCPHAVPSRSAQFPRDGAPGHPAGGNAMGPAEAESWRRCRLTRVAQMAEAVPRRVRAGRPRSRVGCPSPVALLPPRGSGRPLPFSMPIDTYGRRWSLKQVHRSSCPWEFIRGSSSIQNDDHRRLPLSKVPHSKAGLGSPAISPAAIRSSL